MIHKVTATVLLIVILMGQFASAKSTDFPDSALPSPIQEVNEAIGIQEWTTKPPIIELAPSLYQEQYALEQARMVASSQPKVRQPQNSHLESYRGIFLEYFNDSQWGAFLELVRKESSGSFYAVNPSSGACGLPQALPCSKLLRVIGSLNNHEGQIRWMFGYIRDRYVSPSQALAFHHRRGWY